MTIDVRRMGELAEGDLIEMVNESGRTECAGLVYYLWPDTERNTVTIWVVMCLPGCGIYTKQDVVDADQQVGVFTQGKKQR